MLIGMCVSVFMHVNCYKWEFELLSIISRLRITSLVLLKWRTSDKKTILKQE